MQRLTAAARPACAGRRCRWRRPPPALPRSSTLTRPCWPAPRAPPTRSRKAQASTTICLNQGRRRRRAWVPVRGWLPRDRRDAVSAAAARVLHCVPGRTGMWSTSQIFLTAAGCCAGGVRGVRRRVGVAGRCGHVPVHGARRHPQCGSRCTTTTHPLQSSSMWMGALRAPSRVSRARRGLSARRVSAWPVRRRSCRPATAHRARARRHTPWSIMRASPTARHAPRPAPPACPAPPWPQPPPCPHRRPTLPTRHVACRCGDATDAVQSLGSSLESSVLQQDLLAAYILCRARGLHSPRALTRAGHAAGRRAVPAAGKLLRAAAVRRCGRGMRGVRHLGRVGARRRARLARLASTHHIHIQDHHTFMHPAHSPGSTCMCSCPQAGGAALAVVQCRQRGGHSHQPQHHRLVQQHGRCGHRTSGPSTNAGQAALGQLATLQLLAAVYAVDGTFIAFENMTSQLQVGARVTHRPSHVHSCVRRPPAPRPRSFALALPLRMGAS